jgi:hypothetical protein
MEKRMAVMPTKKPPDNNRAEPWEACCYRRSQGDRERGERKKRTVWTLPAGCHLPPTLDSSREPNSPTANDYGLFRERQSIEWDQYFLGNILGNNDTSRFVTVISVAGSHSVRWGRTARILCYMSVSGGRERSVPSPPIIQLKMAKRDQPRFDQPIWYFRSYHPTSLSNRIESNRVRINLQALLRTRGTTRRCCCDGCTAVSVLLQSLQQKTSIDSSIARVRRIYQTAISGENHLGREHKKFRTMPTL